MEFIFLSQIVPPFLVDEYRCNSKNNMQDAAIALQNHIYEGLSLNLQKKIPIFNVLPICSFPQYYKKAFVPHENNNNEKEYVENIGFCNVKWIRNFSIQKNIYRSLYKWFLKHPEKTTIFVYTLAPFFLKPVNKITKRFKNVKVCAIVADLPNMMSLKSKRSVFERASSLFLTRYSLSLLNCVDYFVLLTKQMADYMNIKRPYCVVEGIATVLSHKNTSNTSIEKKKIFYAGTLHEKFGVKCLIDAFELIDDENYVLIICGTGDSEDYIKAMSEKDSRVLFYGQQSREKVLELMSEASVLVNPRPNNEEFTKYSFPSKNLEYLSSGIPFVGYKLDGIPDEYDAFINYIPDNTLDSLKRTLVDVCEKNYEDAKNKALHAVDFVMKEKNSVIQTKKMIDLCLTNVKE